MATLIRVRLLVSFDGTFAGYKEWGRAATKPETVREWLERADEE